MNDETHRALNRLQRQVNTLARFTGQALEALNFNAPDKRDALDVVVAHWTEITEGDTSRRRVIDRVREGVGQMREAIETSRSASEREADPAEGSS